MQEEYEYKLQEIEERMGSVTATERKSTLGKLLSNNQEEDDDLLENFDGIPRFSIMDLLENQRDSIVPRSNYETLVRKRETMSKRGGTEPSQLPRKTTRQSNA